MEKNSRNINILLKVEDNFIPKAEYVFRTFCKVVGLRPRFFYHFSLDKIHITYSPNILEESNIHICHNPKAVEFFNNNEVYPQSKVNKVLFKKEYIPFLFSHTGDIFTVSKSKTIIRKDIISSAFYFLSCWQEHILLQQNTEQRFSFFASLQYENDFADIPIVDRYCEIFQRAILVHLPEFSTNRIWLEDKSFALSLSHDIDYWDYWDNHYTQEMMRYNFNRLKTKSFLKGFYKLVFHFLDKKIGNNSTFNTTKKIYKKERKWGISSTNFLLTANHFQDNRQNYFDDERVREQIKKLYQNKKIGLHSSPKAAKDLEQLQKEQQSLLNLGIHFKGNRVHFLHMNYHTTFKLLENAGFSYDATLSYWENYGFRAGISYPFYPFDLENNRPFSFLEIPLTVMDSTVFSKNAMHLSKKEALKRLKLMIDFSAQHQSHISFLWHNTTFDRIDYPGWGDVYWKLIRYAKKKKAWVTSLDDVFQYWIQR